MEMHQIRYFLALSEELNFTRAAARCHVTQPSLTRAVRLLEQELGGALIHRARANTRLTTLGEIMLPQLWEIVRKAEAAKAQAHAFKEAWDDAAPRAEPVIMGLRASRERRPEPSLVKP